MDSRAPHIDLQLQPAVGGELQPAVDGEFQPAVGGELHSPLLPIDESATIAVFLSEARQTRHVLLNAAEDELCNWHRAKEIEWSQQSFGTVRLGEDDDEQNPYGFNWEQEALEQENERVRREKELLDRRNEVYGRVWVEFQCWVEEEERRLGLESVWLNRFEYELEGKPVRNR